ncbi:hypothetical protein ACROYT_G019606 [Oculina patagonica]
MVLFKVLFITLCVVASSLASCMPEHPQKQFCKAGFVIRAKVLSRPTAADMPNSVNNMPWKPYQVYKLRILATFKGREHVQKNLIPSRSFYFVNLYTPSNGVSSRVPLVPGVEYLLSGKIVNGYLYTSFCNWRQKWADVTYEQSTGVQMQYSRGCRCSIGFSFCFTKDCPKLLTGCDGFDPSAECRAKYDRCAINIGGQNCGWQVNSRFEQCTKISKRFFPY